MAYEVHKLPGESIVITVFTSPFDPTTDIVQSSAEALKLAQDIQGQSYRIVDVSRLDVSFGTLVEGLFRATHGTTSDPNIHGLLVGSGAMVALASKAMGQKQYGALSVPMFASLDEALAHARAELTK